MLPEQHCHWLKLLKVSQYIQHASQMKPPRRGPCGQTFAEDISSRLLIFNTSLHLHQIPLRPECSKTDSFAPPPPPTPILSISLSLCLLLPLAPSIPPFHCLNPVVNTQWRVSTWTIAVRLYPAVETSAHSSVSHIVQDVEVNKQTNQNNTAGATLTKSKEPLR